MAGVTGKAQIDQAVDKFLAEARFTLQERPGVVKSSVEVITLPENEGPSVNVPKYGTVSTSALTEGVDMNQAQQITDTGMVITPAEFGAQVVLTDMMLMTVHDEFFRVAGRVLAESFDRQQDQTLCDDFDAFSNALGGAGTALTVGHVMAAHASIKWAGSDGGATRGGEPAPDPTTGVFTPPMIHALNKSLIGGAGASGNTSITPETERAFSTEGQFSIPGLPGLTIKSDVNLIKDSSDDSKAAVFSKQATILVELGGGPSEERERDASLRGWEVNFVGRWARSEYNDNWGREMLFDTSLPTS